MPFLIFQEFLFCRRSGAYQAHVPFQYVKKLGELVDTGLPDELSHPGNSGVIFHLKHQAALHLILRFQVFQPLLGICIHGTEFVDMKASAVGSDTGLLKDDGAGGLQVNGRSYKSPQYQGKDHSHQAAADIHAPLQEQVCLVKDAGRISKHMIHAEPADGLLLFLQTEGIYRHMDGNAHSLQLLNEPAQLLLIVLRNTDQGLIYHLASQIFQKVIHRLHISAEFPVLYRIGFGIFSVYESRPQYSDRRYLIIIEV